MIKQMTNFVILLILSITTVQAETFIIQMDNQKVSVEFFNIQGALINDVCKESLQTCKAINVYNGAPNFPKKLKMGLLSSEAQAYCKHLKGIPLTLLNSKNEGFAFCSFEDMSIINSWDLFNKHLKLKNNKK